MSASHRTLDEVRRVGLDALARELGSADFVRFLQMFEMGRGDYTEERRQWLDGLDGETIVEMIRKRRAQPPEDGPRKDGADHAEGTDA